MRRPLNADFNGNGTPIVVDGPGNFFAFDTAELDPNQTYAVTLYMWFQPGLTNITQLVVLDTDVPIGRPIALYPPTALALLQGLGQGSAKLADRLIMRGQQQLIVTTTSYSTDAWFFGYFERVGEQEEKREWRPLQPVDPQAPFDAPFVSASAVAGAAKVTQLAHQLDINEERLDEVSLTVTAFTLGAPGSAKVEVSFPGLASPLLILPKDIATEAFPFRIMDGIPMRALGPAKSAAESQITIASEPDAATDLQGTIFGRFTRG